MGGGSVLYISIHSLSLSHILLAAILIRDQASQLCCNKKTVFFSVCVLCERQEFCLSCNIYVGEAWRCFLSSFFFFLVTTVSKEQPSDVAPCFQKLNNSGRSRESQQGADGGNFESVLRSRCQARRQPTGRIHGCRWSEVKIGLQQSPRCWIPT